MKPTFQGEVQFAGYADGSRGGPRVTLRLADRDELDKFIGKEGKRFMAVLVEIADDETPAEPEKPAPARSAAPVKRHGPLCQWAVERCGEPVFQSWLRPRYDRALVGNGSGWGDVTPMDDFGGNTKAAHAAYTAHCIKVLCQVESRTEFDTDAAAGERFKTLVMRPYAAWLKEQQEVPA